MSSVQSEPIESESSTISNQKSILNHHEKEVKKSFQNFPKIAMIIHSILQLICGILTIILHCTFLYGFDYFGVKWFNFAIICGIIFLIPGLFGIMTGSFLPYKNLAIVYLVTTILASILALLLLFPIVFGILISLTSHRRPYFDYRKQYYWCEGLAIGEKLIPLKKSTKILKSFHFACSLFQQCIP